MIIPASGAKFVTLHSCTVVESVTLSDTVTVTELDVCFAVSVLTPFSH